MYVKNHEVNNFQQKHKLEKNNHKDKVYDSHSVGRNHFVLFEVTSKIYQISQQITN